MKILAIDTSTEACSAALYIDGAVQLAFEIAPQQHAQLILQQCDKLLADADLKPRQLDVVAFGRGPGSFTGLRIAAGVTQGIAFACDLPVIGISTLAIQAQQICHQYPEHLYLSTIDARMKEIYWGVYALGANQLVEAKSEERVSPPENIILPKNQHIIGIGSGWKVYRENIEAALQEHAVSEVYSTVLPSAEALAILAADKFMRGETQSAEQAIPVYLRNNVAKKSTR